MTNIELDNQVMEFDRKNRLAPVTHMVRLHGPLARALQLYARSQGCDQETIIKEAIRVYIGDAAR